MSKPVSADGNEGKDGKRMGISKPLGFVRTMILIVVIIALGFFAQYLLS